MFKRLFQKIKNIKKYKKNEKKCAFASKLKSVKFKKL